MGIGMGELFWETYFYILIRDLQIANRELQIMKQSCKFVVNEVEMRPQDVIILLKIVSMDQEEWRLIDIAYNLRISQSEVSESLRRSQYAGLMDSSRKKVFRRSLLDLLVYGVKYVFPARPGELVVGLPTAHSAPPLNDTIVASPSDQYVWPYEGGTHRGFAIEPLYRTLPQAAEKDQELYELLALVDAVRVGRAREYNLAVEELKKRIL